MFQGAFFAVCVLVLMRLLRHLRTPADKHAEEQDAFRKGRVAGSYLYAMCSQWPHIDDDMDSHLNNRVMSMLNTLDEPYRTKFSEGLDSGISLAKAAVENHLTRSSYIQQQDIMKVGEMLKMVIDDINKGSKGSAVARLTRAIETLNRTNRS